MNNTVNQAIIIDKTAATAKQQPKAKNSGGAGFGNMLADALNGDAKSVDTPQAPQTGEGTADDVQPEPAKTDSQMQAHGQTKQREEPPVQEDDDTEEYGYQAVSAAMQMQTMIPVMTETPQTEIPAEADAAAIEAVDSYPVQAAAAETTAVEGPQARPAQEVAKQDIQAEDGTMFKPQATEETFARTIRATVRQAEEQAAVSTEGAEKASEAEHRGQAAVTARTEQTGQQPQAEPQPAGRKDSEISEEIKSDVTEARVLRQPQPAVHMHNLRHSQKVDTAQVRQARFDEMLTRASQELNQGTPEAEASPVEEIPEETPTLEQPIILEETPQKTEKQVEIPEAEIKPQEEAKPAHVAQATVQKSEKAPVTEQRPQKEISKQDEAVLGMIQPKQTVTVHEVIRSEPAPQQPQQVQLPDQAEQIKAQVIRSMENQRTEFQMQLHPEELGKINVKMILESGKLTVEIVAANPKSADMLARQAESLAAALKAGDIETASVNVVTANENASAQMNGQYDLNNFQNQFENQSNGQKQSGRANGARTMREQTKNREQTERERPWAPQRILNYSV